MRQSRHTDEEERDTIYIVSKYAGKSSPCEKVAWDWDESIARSFAHLNTLSERKEKHFVSNFLISDYSMREEIVEELFSKRPSLSEFEPVAGYADLFSKALFIPNTEGFLIKLCFKTKTEPTERGSRLVVTKYSFSYSINFFGVMNGNRRVFRETTFQKRRLFKNPDCDLDFESLSFPLSCEDELTMPEALDRVSIVVEELEAWILTRYLSEEALNEQ